MNLGRCYFNSICEEDEKIWFVSLGLVFCLFQMDKVSGDLQCLGILPIDYEKGEAYSAIGKINDRIIMAPYYSKGFFLEFSLCSRQFKKIPLIHDVYSGNGTFNQVIEHNNTLLFIGCANGLIVEVNDRYQYRYHFEWAEELEYQIDNQLFFAGCVCIDSTLFLPIFNSNIIIELNMDNWTSKITKMPVEYKIVSQFYDGRMLWYLPLEGNRIITYKANEKEFGHIIMPLNPKGVRSFKTILFDENETRVIINNENKYFVILSTGQILERTNEVASILRTGDIVRICLDVHDKGCNQCVYFLCDDTLLETNGNYMKQYAVDIDYDEICKIDSFRSANWEMGKKYERNSRSLNNFISLSKKPDESKRQQGMYGEKIYSKLCL